MVAISGSRDCGNSPKNQFAQDVAIALETGNVPPDMLDGKVAWSGVPDGPAEGIDAVLRLIAQQPAITSIVIEHAISHGRVGMANGVVTLENGTNRRFSHVFDFTSAKGDRVAAISSYG